MPVRIPKLDTSVDLEPPKRSQWIIERLDTVIKDQTTAEIAPHFCPRTLDHQLLEETFGFASQKSSAYEIVGRHTELPVMQHETFSDEFEQPRKLGRIKWQREARMRSAPIPPQDLALPMD